MFAAIDIPLQAVRVTWTASLPLLAFRFEVRIYVANHYRRNFPTMWTFG